MNKKLNYTHIEDLIQDESFRKWILDTKPNPDWEEFAISSKQNARLVESAKSFLISFNCIEEQFTEEEVEDQYNLLRDKLNLKSNKKKVYYSRLLVASIITILLSGGYFFTGLNHNPIDPQFEESEPEGLIEEINNSHSPKLITLSDGSSVILQPNSQLSYSNEFDVIKREVFLKGEAFFEVSKNEYKPFIVYSNDVVTQVYGTSFRIIAFDEQDEVKVIVKTGKVKLRKSKIVEKDDLYEITLLPNQAAKFDRNEKLFGKVLEVSSESPIESDLSPIDKLNFEFVDTPISQIFSTLQDLYSIRIQFPEEAMKNCYITTSLSDVPLLEKLKILCFSIGNNTNYEMVGNKIIITSDGCP